MKIHLIGAVALIALSVNLLAQSAQTAPGQAPDSKVRVFITDSKSWEISGGFGGSRDGFGGGTRGGARPQTAEIIKTFEQRCPDLTVTIKQEKADFVVLLDHEGGKGPLSRDNKIAVFNRDGDSIFSLSTRSLGNAIKDACTAIRRHSTPAQQAAPPEPAPVPAAQEGTQPPAAAEVAEPSDLFVKSTPEGADIIVDGRYMGNTPSRMRLAPGDHIISIERTGFRAWQRTITISHGGDITVDAALEKLQ